MGYNPSDFEEKWKKHWADSGIYQVEIDHTKPKYYVLDMFPYPSGAGLHVGHPLGYIASDIFTRFKRLKGYNVLHPMGFDAFGLPAEEYALQTGIHPAVSTQKNMERYRQQLSDLGFSYDWSREVYTCNPSYYKWTQWIFTLLFNHYYDSEAEKAKSINELVERFRKSGNKSVRAANSQEEMFSAAEWNGYSPKKQTDVLMNYRLAYRKIGYVNWCEELGTVLANDQVKDGVSERGGHPVVQKAMTQWYLRITAYAERLLKDLDTIDWSEALKTIQSNWIGRSEGASIFFEVVDHDEKIEVFTTRPDTIFGATYMVLAPLHPLVEILTTKDRRKEVNQYVKYVKAKSEKDRLAEKDVTGVFIGSYAMNPFTNEKIPIWIGEYVLKDYGTGAIMAVPSDDERDLRFAQKYQLPVIDVVDKSDYPGAGVHDKVGKMINSGFISGMEVPDAISALCDKIEEKGIGEKQINYKMRDANFSRQRYWGEPFPIVYTKEGIAEALPLEMLPLELPDSDDFKPGKGGRSPLSRLTSWVELKNGYTRETDVMPAVAGSSWYYLRYMDPHNPDKFANQNALNYWKDVDLYIGGSEHAVAHLMYARFWHKFLYDLVLVPTKEPFKKLVNQGMIQGVIEFMYLDKLQKKPKLFVSKEFVNESNVENFAKIPVHIDFVNDHGTSTSHLDIQGMLQFIEWRPAYKNAHFKTEKGSFPANTLKKTSSDAAVKLFTVSEIGKMSKSRFNVINPDHVIAEYGRDCFRMFEMFLGPIEQSKPWDTKGIDGVYKFLKKFWALYIDNKGKHRLTDQETTDEELRILHKTIKKVEEDIEKLAFNTAVSAFMICTNDLTRLKCQKKMILEPLLITLSPFAPFITEEIWNRMGNGGSIHDAEYPEFVEDYLKEDVLEYPICFNGRKRDVKDFPRDMSIEEIKKEVLKLDITKKWTAGKEIKKLIVVPGRMVNIVVG